jgi:ribosome maturation factor RimP
MNLSAENIKEIAEEVINNSGYFLIDFLVRGFGKNTVIEIYVDGENYISADDCSKVSREINNRLSSLIQPEDNYRLDVSSPGVDKPLKFIQQFPKHLNKKFELSYKEETGTKKTTGKLTEVKGEMLRFLLNNNEELVLNFKDIIKAKVIISFS